MLGSPGAYWLGRLVSCRENPTYAMTRPVGRERGWLEKIVKYPQKICLQTESMDGYALDGHKEVLAFVVKLPGPWVICGGKHKGRFLSDTTSSVSTEEIPLYVVDSCLAM